MEYEEQKTSEEHLHLRNGQKGLSKELRIINQRSRRKKNQENGKSWKPKQESILRRKERSTVPNTAKRLDKRISEKRPIGFDYGSHEESNQTAVT